MMHALNAAAVSNGANAEDALKVLGRVADAFDNPPLHKTDKEPKLFMVNVVKPRHMLTSFPSGESMCQDTTPPYDSSLDTSYDEDTELAELRDVGIWEHGTSYPYTPRRPHRQRDRRERNLRQDEGMREVNKMLLTSSPLDRLDRLARMELRKTGWIERVDKWTIVEMGLQGVPQTLPKVPSSLRPGEGRERFSSTRTMVVNDGKQTPRRREIGSEYTPHTPERGHRQTKPTTPVSMRSTVDLHDFSTLSYPKLGGRFRRDTRGRLGQVVRNIVKRMLPERYAETTPKSDVSGWTFGSASNWMEASGCWD